MRKSDYLTVAAAIKKCRIASYAPNCERSDIFQTLAKEISEVFANVSPRSRVAVFDGKRQKRFMDAIFPYLVAGLTVDPEVSQIYGGVTECVGPPKVTPVKATPQYSYSHPQPQDIRLRINKDET